MEKKKGQKKDPPKAYQRGSVKFLGCAIGLSEKVLIPRPETGFWAKRAIKDLKKSKDVLKVLDIFSGSGCVGISVLKNAKNSAVDFSDTDPGAVRQIKKNLEENGIEKTRYRIYLSDIFSGLPEIKKYDAILANPPYVDPARISEVQASVLDYEPHIALFGGKRGMAIIKKFLKQARNRLNDQGFIYLEFDPSQKNEIESILKKEKYSSFVFFCDQFKKTRFAKIVK
jgi:release factor glutamine methyltransferase